MNKTKNPYSGYRYSAEIIGQDFANDLRRRADVMDTVSGLHSARLVG